MNVVLVLASCTALAAGQGHEPVFIAHRGGIGDGYPENTLAAFSHAIAAGADAIELDLRATRDGVIIVLHDATVDRTTDGRGRVASMTLAELRRLDAGQGERIPTLEEVLRLVAGTGVWLVLDVKQGGALDRRQVVRLAEAHDAVDRVIVGVRTLEDLRTFRALNPGLRTFGLVEDAANIGEFALAGVDIVRLWPEWIAADPGLIGVVQGLGKPVWVTAGDATPEELAGLVRQGVGGLLVDRLDVIKRVRAPSPPARPARSPAAAACT